MAVKLSNPGTIYVKNIQKAMLNSSKCILSGKLIVYQNDEITRKKITANIYPNQVEIIYSYHA